MGILPWIESCDSSSVVLVDKNGIPLTQAVLEKTLEQVSSLPASQSGVIEDYTNMIAGHPISIIRAETGAGKTTQIPKNVRLKTWQKVNVTQPRVLSAISNATRISHELLCQTENSKYTLGYSEIWYRTWVDTSSKRSASLSFNTAGLEMMRQFYSDLYADITFLDEIQGFWVDLEILMWLFKTRNDFNKRLVIMSATIDPDVFIDYFWNQFGEIPVLDIPWRTYPVDHFHYNEKEEAIPITLWLLSQWKSGLLFVSWKWELYDYIEKFKAAGIDIPIYPLHAELTEAEQMQAVINTNKEQRLIIATNVAEESITPEGVQFVVDLGKHKVSYPNSLGIEELVQEDISKANSMQRAGRAGRMEDGEYHRFNKEDINDIDPYPVPPMSKQMLDREILLFLNKGMDLQDLDKQAKSKWECLFSHEINTSILPIAYSRLEQIGALDRSGNITELGKDLLTMNLDVYHARMLLQAFHEWCVEEMIYLVCILSAKGFLWTDDKWKELFTATHNKQTDVLYHMKMFTDFTSRKLSRQYTNKLASMWIDYKQLDEFHAQVGPVWERKMFFEIVDLDLIGIKNYKLAEIYNLVFVIQKRLSSLWISIDTSHIPKVSEITKNGKQESIQTCLHAGYPFFLSRYDSKKKRFTSSNSQWGIGNLEFQQAKTSLVSPISSKQYSFYPFIIELDGDKESLHLASFVTELQDGCEKRVTEVNERYTSPFASWKWPTKKVSMAWVTELGDRYIEILQDISKIGGREEFLETVLPFMLLVLNHKFHKFIEKNPNKIDVMIQRLSRFLKNNASDYIHRINLQDLSKTERSFTDDTAIYEDFRSWESKFVAQGKKDTRQEMRLSPKQRNDVHEQKQLAMLRKQFITVVGEYNSGKYNLDPTPIRSWVIGKVFQELEATSPTLNIILSFTRDNIWSLDNEETKDVCSKLSRRKKQKYLIAKYRKYIRYLQNTQWELQKLLDWEEGIDRDFLLTFAQSRFFKSESSSQKDKYTKAVTRLLGTSRKKISIKQREAYAQRLEWLIGTLWEYKISLNTTDTVGKQKNKSRMGDVTTLINRVSWVIAWESSITSVELGKLQHNNFYNCFKNDPDTTKLFVSLLSQMLHWSHDSMNERKERTAKRHVQQFINNIWTENENINLELSEHIQGYDNYDMVPLAWELWDILETFLWEIFPSDYLSDKISGEDISEIVTEIYRNNLRWERDVVDIIMKFLIFHNHAGHISHPSITEYMTQERIYTDTKYSVETSYTSPDNYEAIKWVQDKESLASTISELTGKIKTLWESRQALLSMK